MVAVGVVAVALRLVNLARSYDVFVDEVTYLRLSQGIARDLEVKLYGEPFFLHPPAFFFLQAAYLKALSVGGDPIHQVYASRYLNVVLAGVSAAALVHLGRHLSGPLVGLAAGSIFALEPFVLRMNSRNYLETSAIMWVLLGYCVLLPRISSEGGPGPLRRPALVGSGVLFGLALLTKDMTAFLTVAPLGAVFVTGWSLRRRDAAGVGLVTMACYVVYPLGIVATGYWDEFARQKLRGFARFTGQVQETGFNQEGGPSLLQAVLDKLTEFATTYLLIALGGMAVLVLLSSRKPRERLVALWCGSGFAMLLYSGAFGTLEEQFFYYLVVPCILCVAAAWGSLAQRRRTSLDRWVPWLGRSLRTAARATGVALSIVLVSWALFVWQRVHFTADNGAEQVLAYLETHVAPGSHVAATHSPTQFLLEGYYVSLAPDVASLAYSDVEYVVVSEKLIRSGYSIASVPVIDWLATHGERVFAFEGPSLGDLQIYRIDRGWEPSSPLQPPSPLSAAPGARRVDTLRMSSR